MLLSYFNLQILDYSPSLHRLLYSRLLSPSFADGHGTMAALSSRIKRSYAAPLVLQATRFSPSCFIACNRSTSGTFYVPIFLSVHDSFRLPFWPVRLTMPVTSQGLSVRPIYSTSRTPLSRQRHFYRFFFETISFGLLSVAVNHILAMRAL